MTFILTRKQPPPPHADHSGFRRTLSRTLPARGAASWSQPPALMEAMAESDVGMMMFEVLLKHHKNDYEGSVVKIEEWRGLLNILERFLEIARNHPDGWEHVMKSLGDQEGAKGPQGFRPTASREKDEGLFEANYEPEERPLRKPGDGDPPPRR